MHQRFHYKTIAELEADLDGLNLSIDFDSDLGPLHRPVEIYNERAANSLGIQPMEGCDGTSDGKPAELTVRRYQRFAAGGAGLIWFEATAVARAGRANPRQLYATPGNTKALAELLTAARRAGKEVYGPAHDFVAVLQLTHSGRYSKPDGAARPIIAQHNPYLDPKLGIDASYPLISDAELERLEDDYVRAAQVACEAGFHILDIKSCHRYLIAELLAAHLREGRYGGDFENRSRFLLNIIDKIQAVLGPKVALAVRLNAWDGMPYPYGWGISPASAGMAPGGNIPCDLTEPQRLLKELIKRGVRLVNLSLANPYYQPHLTRPYDHPSQGLSLPDEHPLVGVGRFFTITKEISAAFPELTIMGGGYSWLRQFAGNAAAANLRRGIGSIAGFGREAFAYPEFARDLLERGALNPERVCVTCSKCTDLMRNGGRTGCVVRDSQIYKII